MHNATRRYRFKISPKRKTEESKKWCSKPHVRAQPPLCFQHHHSNNKTCQASTVSKWCRSLTSPSISLQVRVMFHDSQSGAGCGCGCNWCPAAQLNAWSKETRAPGSAQRLAVRPPHPPHDAAAEAGLRAAMMGRGRPTWGRRRSCH